MSLARWPAFWPLTPLGRQVWGMSEAVGRGGWVQLGQLCAYSQRVCCEQGSEAAVLPPGVGGEVPAPCSACCPAAPGSEGIPPRQSALFQAESWALCVMCPQPVLVSSPEHYVQCPARDPRPRSTYPIALPEKLRGSADTPLHPS